VTTSIIAIPPPIFQDPVRNHAIINVSVDATTLQVIVFAICLLLFIFTLLIILLFSAYKITKISALKYNMIIKVNNVLSHLHEKNQKFLYYSSY